VGALRLERIGKKFGTVEVLRDVELEVRDGEFVVLVGPSGCGKSTLLRIIAGLEDQGGGHVRIDGRIVDAVPPARRGIAMVFQSYALYPHLDVAGNMGLALRQAGTAPDIVRARVADAARMLRLEDLLARKPAALSGGQRQRVAIGRAIVREPRLFLFDEPLSNLDAALRVNTRLEIAKLHRLLKATIVYVTHDQIEAMTLADRIVVMNGGRIEQVGRPIELYHRPANLFVAGFIGSPTMNFIAGGPAQRLGAATLGIRPEHLAVVTAPRGGATAEAQALAQMDGTVAHVEHLGADSFVYVEVQDHGTLVARVIGDTAIVAGDRVGLLAQPGAVHRFDEGGRTLA